PAFHPWRAPYRRVSGDGMRVEPSLMHPEGGSWTRVRTHTPSKVSKVLMNLWLPSPWITPSFGRTGRSPLRTVLATSHRTRLSTLLQQMSHIGERSGM